MRIIYLQNKNTHSLTHKPVIFFYGQKHMIFLKFLKIDLLSVVNLLSVSSPYNIDKRRDYNKIKMACDDVVDVTNRIERLN